MSNETGLDWLARNVHEWYRNATHVRSDGRGPMWTYLPGWEPSEGWFTHDQWLARRAELQGKPSWKDAPELAEWIFQNGDGIWFAVENKPGEPDDYFRSRKNMGGFGSFLSKGEVLGDWRDTLEKRPEQDEFEPFTSIEDNQEKAMKQDSDWYARGELPPVGAECEAFAEGVRAEKCKIIAYHNQQVAVQWSHFNDGGLDVLSLPGLSFRPINSDRDVLMDAIVSQGFLARDGGVCGQIADAILAAGFSLGAK